jgi:hypothetical protein
MRIPEEAHQDTLRRKCVLQPVGSWGHVLHSSVSGVKNIDALFFRLGCAWYGFYKKRIRTRYAELVFLQPMGPAGHVLHSGVSGVRNVDALLFRLGWGWRGFQKKRTGTRYTELVFFALDGICGPRSAF